DFHVTGVQTCALPISLKASAAVERIVVVGPREALLASGLPSDVDVAEAGDSMVDNLRIGLAKVKKDGLALVATGDIPLLMPEAEIGRASCRESVEIRV